MEGDGQVALGLAAIRLKPELARLLEEELYCRLVLRRDRPVLEEEAAAIQIQRVGRARDVFLRLGPLLDALILFGHPGIEPLERADSGYDVNVRAQVPQPPEAGGDIERNVIIAVPRSEERRVGKECRSRWSPYH